MSCLATVTGTMARPSFITHMMISEPLGVITPKENSRISSSRKEGTTTSMPQLCAGSNSLSECVIHGRWEGLWGVDLVNLGVPPDRRSASVLLVD